MLFFSFHRSSDHEELQVDKVEKPPYFTELDVVTGLEF